jgi:hypothetical protein
MKTKNKISVTVVTAMLIISVFMVIPLPVSADDTVIVIPLWVESSLPYLIHPYPVKDTGTVNYMMLVINSTSRTELLTNYTFAMSYNPKVLKLLSVKEGYPSVYGGFLNRSVYNPDGSYNATATAGLRAYKGGGPTNFSYSFLLNMSTGLIDVTISCAQTGGTPSTFLPQGFGDPLLPGDLELLALLVWMPIDYGKCPITLNGFYLDDVGGKHVYPEIVFPPGWATGEQGFYALVRHTVQFSPPQIIWREPPHETPPAGENFTLPLTIITSEDVHSWTATVTWDKDVIKCLGATEGMFLQTWGSPIYPLGNTTWTTPVIDNNAGTASLGCTLDPGLSNTGHGTLANLVFEALDYGETDIMMTACSTKNVTDGEIYTLVGYPVNYSEKGYFEFYKEVTVGFDPASVDWTLAGKAIGQSFTVNLTISTSHEVHSWKAGFSFNPLVLECTSVTEGPWLATGGSTTWTPGQINNTKGEVTSYNCTLDAAGANATDAGVLATIEFKVLDYGESDIVLTYLIGDPTETRLVDTDLNKINIDKLSDGQFRFRSGAMVSLCVDDPPKAYSPYIDSWTWITDDTFLVNVTISTLEKLSSWSLSLSFDSGVLQCNSVDEGPWLATGGATQWLPGLIGSGVVTGYGCSLKGEGLYAIGSGVIATLNFTVVGSGWSTIEITEVKLYDRGWPGVHPTDECDLVSSLSGLRRSGDVDGDRVVDSTDYGIFGVAWPPGPYNVACDFNNDGVIDSTDYGMLGANWGAAY